jgi:outer membrane protein TolC
MSAKSIILGCLFLTAWGSVKAQKVVTNFEEFARYAASKSVALKNGEIQLTQAQKAQLSSIYGIIDPTGNLSGTYTNNTQLPVNLFPAEILGGQAGTYKEVQLGVQYQTNFNLNLDIKLFNRQGWENLKLSKINVEMLASDNKISLKNLHENTAVVYFNIVTLQEQLKATAINRGAADTLYASVFRKFQQGLVKQQDVNDAKINVLTIEQSMQQIKFLISQQYLALKLLCDMPETEDLQIDEAVSSDVLKPIPPIERTSLLVNNTLIKENFAQSNYKKSLYGYLPTLSFFAAATTQQYNTKGTLFDGNVNWIPSNYVGLRLNIPIPSSNTIAQVSKAKYDVLLSKNNVEQAKIKTDLDVKQLEIAYNKALSQVKSNKDIYEIRKDTYQKNLLNYNAGIISIDQTLDSFNAMVNSNYDLISSTISVLLAEVKINIQNKIK